MSLDLVRATFFEECDECLAAAEEALAGLRDGAGDTSDLVNRVFRAVHSIKGGAGAFGYDALVHFAHRFETALDRLRDGRAEASDAAMALMQRSRDVLDDHVRAARTGDVAPVAPEIESALDQMADGVVPTDTQAPGPGPGQEAAAGRTVRVVPSPAALQNGGEPLYLLRELVRMGCGPVRLDTSELPPLADLDPAGAYLSWDLCMPAGLDESAVREVFEFSGDEIAVRFVAPPPPPSAPHPEPVTMPQPAVEHSAGAKPQPQPQPQLLPDAPPEPAHGAEIVPLRRGPEPAAAPAGAATAQSQRVVRVDLNRVDRVVNLVGELVINQAMLAQRLDVTSDDVAEAMVSLDQLTRELQDAVMAMRAQPIRTVFERVPRLVRELETETGKRVSLEVSGEATEVDKTVVERIGEPITHIIRNAVDHGLEPPDDRIKAGKPATGIIRLCAEHRGGRILITVSDDGRGLDRARILAKAVERGIVSPDANLSDEEIEQLIFAPGFSTASAVSNISGRGVGMDVVRQSVQALGGRVLVSSRPGHGTSISLILPLTLAIMDGMVVAVGQSTYVIPVNAIFEIIKPAPHQLCPVSSGGMMLDVRRDRDDAHPGQRSNERASRAGQRYVPIVQVAGALGVPDGIRTPEEGVLVIVESQRVGRAALLVDEVRDQRQIVIKSLETNFASVAGVAGATIMGDGSVGLILDVEALIASVTAASAAPVPLRREAIG